MLSMRIVSCFAALVSLAACQSRVAQRVDPEAMVKEATMSDGDIRFNPDVLRPGTYRSQVLAAFGPPNDIDTRSGVRVELYKFNADGTKFVDPQTHARNVAAGVATGGIATAVRAARIVATEEQVTTYRLYYGPDARLQSVQKQ